jgi:DNA polymerase-1
VLIDAAVLARQSQQLAERMVALEQEAYAIAGQPFNMGSPSRSARSSSASSACR